MNVAELFQTLSFGELSNLSIGMEGAGTVDEARQGRLIVHTNAALTEIYSRFIHKVGFLTVVLEEDRKTYPLMTKYAVSDTTPNNTAPRYIQDTEADPFLGDVLRILSVEVVDAMDPTGCLELIETRALAYDALYVSNPRAGAVLEIEYQAKHPKLSIPVDLTEEIYLAPLLEEALQVRIAAGVYSAMDGEAQLAKSMVLLRKFEAMCTLAKLEGLVPESPLKDLGKLGKAGWR